MFTAVCAVFAVTATFFWIINIYDNAKDYKQAKEALMRAKECCPYNRNVLEYHKNRLSLFKTRLTTNIVVTVLLVISIVILGV